MSRSVFTTGGLSLRALFSMYICEILANFSRCSRKKPKRCMGKVETVNNHYSEFINIKNVT